MAERGPWAGVRGARPPLSLVQGGRGDLVRVVVGDAHKVMEQLGQVQLGVGQHAGVVGLDDVILFGLSQFSKVVSNQRRINDPSLFGSVLSKVNRKSQFLT